MNLLHIFYYKVLAEFILNLIIIYYKNQKINLYNNYIVEVKIIITIRLNNFEEIYHNKFGRMKSEFNILF